jgi:hypothetical protein
MAFLSRSAILIATIRSLKLREPLPDPIRLISNSGGRQTVRALGIPNNQLLRMRNQSVQKVNNYRER